MSIEYYSSMMCADFSNLEKVVKELEAAGVSGFHCDVMDGAFVSNMTMGPIGVSAIRKNTNKLVDVHLMVENPSKMIDIYVSIGVDLIYIHPESERYVIKTLQYIKENNIKSGLAINPDTSFYNVVEMLPFVDYVMIMSVNPGFAGQDFIESVSDKILMFNKHKEKYGYKLVLDGAVSGDIIGKYKNYGIDGFVLGTKTLFRDDHNYSDTMKALRKIEKEG